MNCSGNKTEDHSKKKPAHHIRAGFIISACKKTHILLQALIKAKFNDYSVVE